MTATTQTGQASAPAAPAAAQPNPEPAKWRTYFRMPRKLATPVPLWTGWLTIILGLAILGIAFISIGLDARADVSVWLGDKTNLKPLNAAIVRAQAISHDTGAVAHDHPNWSTYRKTLHAMVTTYDGLDQQPPSKIANPVPDSAPLEMMLIESWTRSAAGKGDKAITKSVAQHILSFNTFCEANSAILIFILVWYWMTRTTRDLIPPNLKKIMLWPLSPPSPLPAPTLLSTLSSPPARASWGDPLLLAPLVLLGIAEICRVLFTFTPTGLDTQPVGPLDDRMLSIGFWAFATLRFLTAICLARFLPKPFRAITCAFIAASLVWLNPVLLFGDHAMPSWDVWAAPLFLLAALLVSLDWWLTAGIVLAIGCVFRGQTIWAVPVLLLCPLFAGWAGRFFKIAGAWGVTMAIFLWPWMVSNHAGGTYIMLAIAVAAVMCILAIFRPAVHAHLANLTQPNPNAGWKEHLRKYLPATLTGALLLTALIAMWIGARKSGQPPFWTFTFCIALLAIPFVIPKRIILSWMLFVVAAALWLGAFHFGGNGSIWRIGYAFATSSYQQAGARGNNTLGNLDGVMEQKFSWKVTDPLSDFHIPITGAHIQWNMGQTLTAFYFFAAIAVAAGAAMQLRKRDPKFLIALVAPWMLAATLITPMPASFMVLPAILAASLVGVSTGMSLMQFMAIIVGCVMILAQILTAQLAPATFGIVRPTAPDLGWMMPLAAAVFLYMTLIPNRPLDAEDQPA